MLPRGPKCIGRFFFCRTDLIHKLFLPLKLPIVLNIHGHAPYMYIYVHHYIIWSTNTLVYALSKVRSCFLCVQPVQYTPHFLHTISPSLSKEPFVIRARKGPLSLNTLYIEFFCFFPFASCMLVLSFRNSNFSPCFSGLKVWKKKSYSLCLLL